MSKPRKITISDEDIEHNQPSNKPDIDDLLVKFRYAANKTEEVVAKQALYQLLASEAVDMHPTEGWQDRLILAIPLSKLAEVFGMEGNE